MSFSRRSSPPIGDGFAPWDREERGAVTRRLSSDETVTCTLGLPEQDNRWRAKVWDVSPQGIGLLSGQRLEPGRLVSLHVTNRASGWSRALALRVAHVTRLPNGKHLLGCVFAEDLLPDEFSALFVSTGR